MIESKSFIKYSPKCIRFEFQIMARSVIITNITSDKILKFVETMLLTIFVKFAKASLEKFYLINPIRHGSGEEEHIVPASDSFVCCGSIRDLEKKTFSDNF